MLYVVLFLLGLAAGLFGGYFFVKRLLLSVTSAGVGGQIPSPAKLEEIIKEEVLDDADRQKIIDRLKEAFDLEDGNN